MAALSAVERVYHTKKVFFLAIPAKLATLPEAKKYHLRVQADTFNSPAFLIENLTQIPPSRKAMVDKYADLVEKRRKKVVIRRI